MREMIIYGIIGFLFCFFQITGYDLAARGNIIWSVDYTVWLILESVAGGAVFGFLWHVLRGRVGLLREKAMPQNSVRPWQIWLVSFCLIFLCWLPCYLAYYPGICAYDTTIQTGQIVDGLYNDHHPIAHTLLIAGGMKLGQAVFGDANDGIGLLVFTQMSLLAAVYAWGVSFLWRVLLWKRKPAAGKLATGMLTPEGFVAEESAPGKLAAEGIPSVEPAAGRQEAGRPGRLSIGILACVQMFGMFYPFHMYMSVSLIKDVFFSIFFLAQLLALCGLLRSRRLALNWFDGIYLIGAIGMQLFRNNGRYALLVLFGAVFLAMVFGKKERKFWAKLAGLNLLALVIGTVCLSGLFRLTGAQQGDRREMLSMPIQQMARCMLYHGGVGELPEDDGTMDAQSVALVNDFLLDESYRLYRPEISDPVKSHTNTYVVRYRTGEFIKTYLQLFASYPGDFINAALAVDAGYLYMADISHAQVNQNGTDHGLGYVQTRWVESELAPRGIYKASKWEWLHGKLEEWADANAYLRYPLLKYLFVPGTCLWLYLLLTGALFVRRDYVGCIPLALVMGYYLTLFLGPTVQLRYLYPLMVAFPFLAVALLQGGEAGDVNEAAT